MGITNALQISKHTLLHSWLLN